MVRIFPKNPSYLDQLKLYNFGKSCHLYKFSAVYKMFLYRLSNLILILTLLHGVLVSSKQLKT